MILVLCGTQKQDFSRMINEVEKLTVFEDVVVQAGHNHYQSEKMRIFNFISNDELQRLYEEADLIVTHAGAGSMLQAIKNNKKVIAFPRLSKYGEHVNDHQIELAQKYETLGYLKMFHEGEDMLMLYKKMKQFKPKYYEETGLIRQMIENKILEYTNR